MSIFKKFIFVVVMFGLICSLGGTRSALAYPTKNKATFRFRKSSTSYRDSVALFCPKPVSRSSCRGPKDSPVLALYFFATRLTDQQKLAFGQAVGQGQKGIPEALPAGLIELTLNPRKPFGPEGITGFMVGSVSPNGYGLTGATLDSPDEMKQWKVQFGELSGELRDGGAISYSIAIEMPETKSLIEALGTCKVLFTERSHR